MCGRTGERETLWRPQRSSGSRMTPSGFQLDQVYICSGLFFRLLLGYCPPVWGLSLSLTGGLPDPHGPHTSDMMSVAEFRLLFPQLTGVLTLAFFIHNCIITLMKSNKHQENNVSVCVHHQDNRRSFQCLPAFSGRVCCCVQVRDLSVAYLLVGLTYVYVGVLIFAAFPSPPLSKRCIEPVSFQNPRRFLSPRPPCSVPPEMVLARCSSRGF